jgi:hypothetical protein
MTWKQGAIYYNFIKNTFSERYPDYKIIFRVIVIDNYLQIALVRIKVETMQEGLINFKCMLNELEYHFSERRFDLPYSIAINNEILL